MFTNYNFRQKGIVCRSQTLYRPRRALIVCSEQIGFSDVKAKQKEAILDTFVSLPTGYGKSLIFDTNKHPFRLFLRMTKVVMCLAYAYQFIKDLLRIFITCSMKLFFQCSSGKWSKTNTAKLVNLLHSGNVL